MLAWSWRLRPHAKAQLSDSRPNRCVELTTAMKDALAVLTAVSYDQCQARHYTLRNWRGRKARRAWCEAPATPVLLFQQVSSHEAHNSRGTFALTPPNKPLKPSRPGAGPAAEPPELSQGCSASRRPTSLSRR